MGNIGTIPVIRLEVERMKHSILTVLSEHAAQMDASIHAAVEAYCTEQNIDAVVRKAAMEHLDMAIKEEVRNFFQFSGAGRKAVREAVHEYLNRQFPQDDQ